jgi:hypothetical protein
MKKAKVVTQEWTVKASGALSAEEAGLRDNLISSVLDFFDHLWELKKVDKVRARQVLEIVMSSHHDLRMALEALVAEEEELRDGG